MTAINFDDYLTKQLRVSNNVVTYRSLSRDLGVHVNVAKDELLKYHTANSSSNYVHATYLVAGEVNPPPQRMSIDIMEGEDVNEEEEDEDEDDYVERLQMFLVGEENLEGSKSKFVATPTISLYSLSPAPIRNGNLICTPTLALRQIDAKKREELAKAKATEGQTDTKTGGEWSSIVGRIVGKDVKFKGGKPPIASTSKLDPPPAAITATVETKPTTSTKDASKTNPADIPKAAEKPKATGKLDWSSAKTKDQKAAEAKDAKKEEVAVRKEEAAVKKKKKEEEAKKAAESKQKKAVKEEERTLEVPKDDKRGTKRKSTGALMSSDSEDETPVPPPKVKVQPKEKARTLVKKSILSSDEDEAEEDVAPRRLQKGRSIINMKARARAKPLVSASDSGSDTKQEFAKKHDSETEKSLRAMMDVDDDDIERISRPPSTRPPTEGSTAASDDDIDMSDGDTAGKTALDEGNESEASPKKQVKKRKPKKVWPVGGNGLRKRRVIKTKEGTDAKGYFVSEDYSEYESVDEEEEEEAPKIKSKAKAKVEETKLSKANETKAKAATSKLAASHSGTKNKSGGAAKGGIQNFFGKK